MSNKKVIIYRKSKGQIVVQGEVKLTNEEGKEIQHKDRFTLCGCSKSKKLPFCDGSHKEEI
ncbi:MAG: iron-binding protein [Flavobacteriaceae bacterium]|nr:iron-binding protein [Flavobacteriaceae bacterium]|tara:strand:+ start:703 stop:885 length:183 start_codon:yes stop_codon:yes gene_type:complete